MVRKQVVYISGHSVNLYNTRNKEKKISGVSSWKMSAWLTSIGTRSVDSPKIS